MNHPAALAAAVTWFGAMAFAQFYGYDLPTEAEWEKAARGPDHADQGTHCLYAWGNDMVNAKGNFAYDGNNPATQRPVGYYDGNQTPSGPDMANGFSLYDMTGNASEWTRTIAAIVTTYMTGADNTIGADVALYDNGEGTLVGSAGGGTISYATGTWSFTLKDTEAKSYGRGIAVEYSYWGDVSGTGVSYYPAKEDFSASQHRYWSSPSNFFFKTGALIFSNSIPSAAASDAGFRVIRRYIPDSSDD